MHFNRKWWLLFVIPLILTGCSDQGTMHNPDLIKQFDTADLIFLSDNNYNAATPWFNPFTEIQIKLELTSPSGKKLSIPGFFDGDGKGGMHGNVFKVRVSPNETGLWYWQSQSNLAELNHLDGSFNVKDTLQGVFSQGPVSISKSHSRRFSFANQKPLFLLGKFLDIDQASHLQFSHTFLSENWSDNQREEFFTHQVTLGINKINIYLANKGDYKGIPTTPWLGTAAYNIKSRFDLHWWHQYEKWTKRFRDQGIIVHLWFFADDSGFKHLTDDERELLITYGMARLSGYTNTIFTLALEWQETFTEDEVRKTGILAQANNPWHRLISVHELSVTKNMEKHSIFSGESWLDFIEIQTGFINHSDIYELGILYANQQNKPAMLEEFSFGENNKEQRINTWAALLTIPAGIGTGSGLKAIAKLLSTVDISNYSPAPELIQTGNAYAATTPDGQAIIYIYKSGSVLLDKKYNAASAQWFNPRDGHYIKPAFKLDTAQALTPPDNQDWALILSH